VIFVKKKTILIISLILIILILIFLFFNASVLGNAAFGFKSHSDCGYCKYILNGTKITSQCSWIKVGIFKGYCKCSVPDGGSQSQGCGFSPMD
jgi:hypothetical protein